VIGRSISRRKGLSRVAEWIPIIITALVVALIVFWLLVRWPNGG
jgi:succinate dehydrogenase hydrophobic anchor subunit